MKPPDNVKPSEYRKPYRRHTNRKHVQTSYRKSAGQFVPREYDIVWKPSMGRGTGWYSITVSVHNE